MVTQTTMDWRDMKGWLEKTFGPISTKKLGSEGFSSSIEGFGIGNHEIEATLSICGNSAEESIVELFNLVVHPPEDNYIIHPDGRFSAVNEYTLEASTIYTPPKFS